MFLKKFDFDPDPEMDPEPDPESELSEKSDQEPDPDPEIIFSLRHTDHTYIHTIILIDTEMECTCVEDSITHY